MFMKKREKRSAAFSCLFSFITKRILWATILLVILLLPSLSSSEEYKNIGFKKEVSKELKQKFPMCNEFLDVKWIDAKRYIGKLKADYYIDNKNQGVSYFLVKAEKIGPYMGTFPTSVFYGCGGQQYNSKEFEKFIQEAEFYFGQGILTAVKGKRKEKFDHLTLPFPPWASTSPPRSSTKSFAHFTKNICLIDSKEETALIIEDKKPFQDENLTGEVKEKYEQILKIANKRCNELKKADKNLSCDMRTLKYGTSIDLDFDGIEDYRCWFWDYDGRKHGVESFIFFTKNGKLNFMYNIPKDCIGADGIYSRAGERAIFIRNCNLTELIKGGK